MARYLYGGTAADVTTTQAGQLVTGATLTVWDSQSGGTQITDLQDATGAATTVVKSDDYGRILFYGPDADTRSFWLESNVGGRVLVRPAASIMPADGSISNVHVNAAAAIARSKIAGTALTADSMGVFSVLDFGAKGDGVTDDTAAIEAAITAAPAGTTVFFPAGVYLVSSPVRLRGGLSYVGEGLATGSGAVIRQKDGSNITGATGRSGVLASDAFLDDASLCGNPVLVKGLHIDGNAAGNPTSDASGIVLNAFWSRIEDCYFTDNPAHGILLTDYTDDGSYVSNSCSENRVTGNRIDTCGGDGIRQESGNGSSNLDGFCRDNLLTQVGNGIKFARAAGWVISRNHLYGCRLGGLALDNCFATVVTDNYVEDFGGENASDGWYTGLYMKMLDGWASHCANNLVNCAEPAGTAHFTCLSWWAGFGQTDARVVLTGNIATGEGGTALSTGINIDHVSGGILTAQYGGNKAFGLATDQYINEDAVIEWAVPIAKPTVSGSRGSNAALTSLCTALANLGLITDSTS